MYSSPIVFTDETCNQMHAVFKLDRAEYLFFTIQAEKA